MVNGNWLGYLFVSSGLHNTISFYNSKEINDYVENINARQLNKKIVFLITGYSNDGEKDLLGDTEIIIIFRIAKYMNSSVISNGFDLNEEETPYMDVMKNQKSPGGYKEDIENKDDIQNKASINIHDQLEQIKWPLEIEAPKILGQTFESLLAAIFVGTNCDTFLSSNKRTEWNFRDCVSFLLRYMGENNNNWDKDFDWAKWIG